MSAGTGVVHSEMNEGAKACRLLQIWIEPSSGGIPPAYEQHHFQIHDGWTPLLDPQGRDGAMTIHRPVRLWRARPQAGQSLAVGIDADRHGWLQMIDGSGQLVAAADGADQPLKRGDGLGFRSDGSSTDGGTFTAGAEGADLLLFELH